MKKRAAILLFFIAAAFSFLFLMPKTPGMKPSRLSKTLPEDVGRWHGIPGEPGEREKQVLAKDTEFRRMQYRDRRGQLPAIETSVVFSGKNLSQSIHRPEVCLRAQGWTFVTESYLQLEGLLPSGQLLPVKEMICKRAAMKPSEKEGDKPTPYLTADGNPVYLWRVFYYTFFGHEAVLAGHYQRTMSDMKDRLFKGYDQRWAYATFSSFITAKHAEQGFSLPGMEVFDEKGTKGLITDFLKQLLPVVVSGPGEGRDPSLEKGNDLGS